MIKDLKIETDAILKEDGEIDGVTQYSSQLQMTIFYGNDTEGWAQVGQYTEPENHPSWDWIMGFIVEMFELGKQEVIDQYAENLAVEMPK